MNPAINGAELHLFVDTACPRREDLDRERWRTVHVPGREYVVLVARNEEKVWFYDIPRRDDHIQR